MVDCIEKRQLTTHRGNALKICRECLHILRDAIGTTHFAEFIDDARESHELLLMAQGKLDQYRGEHGCQTRSTPRLVNDSQAFFSKELIPGYNATPVRDSR